MGKNQTVSILIPAYNEEKSIGKCIDSCLDQTRKADKIIVVNDGSTDNTLEILKSYGNKIKVVDLKENTGNKSKAQEIGLERVDTDIFISTDGDTRLDKKFVENILLSFDKKDVSAACGLVQSEKNNWITNVREINYAVGQAIYKRAQAEAKAIFVLPGPATAYKTGDFKSVITFDHDNVTEDLDFTYKFKLADKNIDFTEDAKVYTQDPNNLKSYFRQLYRWYSGGWTCLKKNFKVLRNPNHALILSLLYLEGLLMGGLLLLSPLLIFINYIFFIYFLAIQFFVVGVSTSYAVIRSNKRYELFLYIPHHYLLSMADQFIFLYTFVREFLLNKKNLVWQRADRY